MTRNPTRRTAPPSPSGAPHKQHNCRYYLDCLDDAAKGDWTDFGCGQCCAFKALPAVDGVMTINGKERYYSIPYRSIQEARMAQILGGMA